MPGAGPLYFAAMKNIVEPNPREAVYPVLGGLPLVSPDPPRPFGQPWLRAGAFFALGMAFKTNLPNPIFREISESSGLGGLALAVLGHFRRLGEQGRVARPEDLAGEPHRGFDLGHAEGTVG